ncbi:DNA adenine methylase [Govanella unica]|uniref:site-specific DNA-methyltransferase (adenine-specific) n=1 Tax=Govanella unica TaxID=2975056 RepID=A0A9X3Z677_9PROT|nr:DNA adenine methylase [Govania unica]MDA5192797.1 DNA adenine methylase [Govania unica]
MTTVPALAPIRPVKPIAGYIGGKRNLAARIVTLIERIPHTAYYEPFVGMGGIFLRRRARPKVEAINDISGDVTNLFRMLAEHYPYVMDLLRFRCTSRDEFERLRAIPGEHLTDLQRAVRFIYLQRLAWGGKVSGRMFGVSPQTSASFDIAKLQPMLEAVHDRLSGVIIERLPYDDFIRRYDHAGALFYLDPPYWNCESDYGDNVFSRDDFAKMAEQLSGITGKFLLSLNDTPGVRKAFSAFHQMPVAVRYSITSTVTARGNERGELLISNTMLPAND